MNKIDIDANVPKYIPKQQIPAHAPLIKDLSDPEAKYYLISFMEYAGKLCQINNLNQGSARKLLTILRNVGCVCTKPKDLREKAGLNMKPVSDSGVYSRLFSGLSQDVGLYEHYLSKSARLFYYTTPYKLFEVIAIRNTHLRIDKNK